MIKTASSQQLNIPCFNTSGERLKYYNMQSNEELKTTTLLKRLSLLCKANSLCAGENNLF